MKILPNGQVEIRNLESGETRTVNPDDLSQYGLTAAYKQMLSTQPLSPSGNQAEDIMKNPSMSSEFKAYYDAKNKTPDKPVSSYFQPTPTPKPAFNSFVEADSSASFDPEAQVRSSSFLTNLGKGAMDFVGGIFSAPKRFGKGLGGTYDVAKDQGAVNSMMKTDQEQIRKNLVLARTLEEQGKKEQAQRLLQENQKIASRMGQYTQRNVETTKTKAEKGTEDVVKGGVGTAAFFVPGGGSTTTRMLAGGLTGGMTGYGLSEKGQELPSIIGGTLTGTAVSGAFELAGAGYKFLRNLTKKPGEAISKEVAKGIGKATPAQWQKALEEHGVDINALIEKYYPEGTSYDQVLGDISKRGRGGVLNDILNAAETKIQATSKAAGINFRISPDDLLLALKKEARLIEKELGGDTRSQAIKTIIKQVEKKYKNGVSLNQAIKILRYANEKFGKNIVDVSAADAVANASQKLEANILKNTIKEMFPELADALRTQEEVLTLRPVLNRARAISNTQGSSLRLGLGQLDLTKPTTWFSAPAQAIGGRPEVSSKFLGAGKKGLLPEIGGPEDVLRNVGIIKSVELLSGGPKSDDYADNRGDYETGKSNFKVGLNHDGIVTGLQPPVNGQLPNITRHTVEELGQAYSDAVMAGDEVNAERIKKLYDTEVKYQADQKKAGKKDLTEVDKKFDFAGRQAQAALNILDKGVESGPLKSLVSKGMEFTGQQDKNITILKSKIAIARTAARNALLGANMSDKEIESLLDFTFDFSLPTPILKERISSFISSMQDYMQNTAGVPEYLPSIENNPLSQ
jgi:hypothetical protein